MVAVKQLSRNPFFYALVIHRKRRLFLVLGDYFNDAFRFSSIKRFGAPLFILIIFIIFILFILFIRIILFCFIEHFKIKKLIVVYICGIGGFIFGDGAPRSEMLVPFAHVAVREFASLAQHFINYFVKAVNVSRECLAVLHMACLKRKRFEIVVKVHAAILAR